MNSSVRVSALAVTAGLVLAGCAARRGGQLVNNEPAIQIRVRTNYYTVDPYEPRSLSRAMWDMGLSDRSGVVGSTAPRFRWTFDQVPDANGCSIRRLSAEGDITITLPRWTPPTGTRGEVRQWFQQYAAAVTTHENTHVRIFEEYLREMLRTVDGYAARTCAAAGDNARALLRAGWERMNTRHAQFDRSDNNLTIRPPP